MPQRLLTVAIPSYNRAAKLDRQLTWLDRNLDGREQDVEVVLSDNASPDATPDVCQKWKDRLSARGVECRVNRNPQNVGPLPNIARCIELATTRFTWVIGDDDDIPDGKLAWVIERLREDPELASIVMNFSSTGKTVYDRCFRFDADQLGPGRQIMSECLRQAYFGLAFMTAQVYRTEFVQAALKAWPQGRTNYDYQVFLTSFAGLQGRVLATHDTHVQYVTGDNIYEKNKRVGLILYGDSLDVFLHLYRIGYPGKLCRWLAWHHLWSLKKRFVKHALQVSPLLTLITAGRTLTYLVRLEMTRLVPAPPTAAVETTPSQSG
jgi:glycosyltransferase involved in cell wall biosynthesis